MKMIKSRKAGIFDLILAIALSLILIVSLVLFTFAQHKTQEKLLEVAPKLQHNFNNINVTDTINESFGEVGDAYSTFKWISVMLIFGFFMSILISAFLVKTHPAWFVGYIFVVVISIIVSVYVSNAYETLLNNPTLASTFAGFFGATWIFLNLPIWVTIIGFLAGILMYINLDTGGYY
jgi:hypothetical protein